MEIETAPKLIHGDFFDVIKSISDNSVDFVFSDPPYFLSNGGFSVSSGKQVSVNKGDWDVIAPGSSQSDFHRRWIEEVRRVMKPDSSIVISGTYHSIFECGVELKTCGFKVLNDIVWFKPNGAPNLSGRRLAASHETLIWAAKSSQSKFTFNYKELKESNFEGDLIKKEGSQLRSVWWIPNTPKSEKRDGGHPTQKPLKLLRRIIQAFTSEGDVVLDPFMGSGTTGVASIESNRKFIGIEREKEYFDLARLRLGGLDFD